MHSDIICGLDIGASSIRALIGDGSGRVLGFGAAPTKGFSKSVVSNLALLSDAIEAGVSKAEEMARCRVRKVITNVSGVHIRTFQSRGSVHISDRPSEITKEDIKRCVESAKVIAMSLDREPVHLIPVRFFIDDKMEINDPLGLFGSKLDVDLNIITSLVTVLQNVTRAVNLAGYEVDDIVASGAGSGLAVFDKTELESGAICADIGKELTELTLFVDGKLRDTFSFPFGGDDLTQVLQDRLKIMFDEAEELKIKYGIVTRELSKIDDAQILVPCLAETRSTSKSEISNLLLPKVEAMAEETQKKLSPFLKNRKSLPRISVIGGVSRMDGVIETIEDIMGVPVGMGVIKGLDDLKDISFACSLGLMRHGVSRLAGARQRYSPKTGNVFAKTFARIKALFSEYF